MTEPTYHPSHDMVEDEDGVDIFRFDMDHHNGPECRRCGSWCHHCEPQRAAQPCESDAATEADRD